MTRRTRCPPSRRSASGPPSSTWSPTRPAWSTPSTRSPAPTTSRALTRRMEDAAEAEIARIDKMGGALKAIESGYFQRALGREQYERNREIEQGRRKWVGVNHLVLPDEKREIKIFRLDERIESEQVARLRRCAPRATTRASRSCSRRCARRRARAPTWCRRAWPRCAPMPRTGSCATRCATCSASTSPTRSWRGCRRCPAKLCGRCASCSPSSAWTPTRSASPSSPTRCARRAWK